MCTSFTTSEIIQIYIACVSSLGILIAFRQLRRFNNQLRLNFFADYTKRYQGIILNFPEEINMSDFDLLKLESSENATYNKTMRYMRAYFDLCSEEFYLNQKKLIDKGMWSVWKSGIEYAFSKTAFKDAWSIVIQDSKFGDDFEKWINGLIDNHEPY